MANGVKNYKIVINGLQESINAVESLNKQLDALEQRINALQTKSINISGGGSASSRTSTKSQLSEEERLAKQIEQIDKKRQAYSKEIYQNYLAAKDVLKETVNDQKQIAASERLQANNYTYTMEGLKQKLADIKQVMQTSEIGSDMFQKYTKEANDLTNKLKELEQAYGQFGRNVGNYKSAAEGFKQLEIEVNGVVRSFANARQAYITLKNERDTMALMGQRETKEFKALDETVKTLASDIKDMSMSSTAMDNILDTMSSFSSMAGIGVGLTQLFGFDDTVFSDSMQKLTSLLLIVKSFETLAKQWQAGEGLFAKMFKPMSEWIDKWAEKKGEETARKYIEGLIKESGKSGDDLRQALATIGTEYEDSLISDMLLGKELSGEISTPEDYAKSFNELKETFAALTKEEKALMYVTEVLNVRVETFDGRIKKVFKFATSAVKLLGKALLTLGGIFTSLVISEALDIIVNFFKTLNSGKIISDRAEASMKALNREFEEQKNILSSNYLKGAITDEQYLTSIYEKQAEVLAQQIALLNDRSKKLEDRGVWGTGLFAQTKGVEFNGQRLDEESGAKLRSGYITQLKLVVNSIGEVEEEWKKCNEAIKEGKDYLDKWGTGIGSWFVTLKDTEEVMRGLGNIRLSDFIAQFGELNQKAKDNKISAEQYAEELAKLKKEMNSNEILNSVIANLDKYIPDEGVRETVQNIINEITRLDDAFNMTSPQQIHHWEQVRIDAMKDGWEKTKAQIKENERWEIVQEGKTAKQKALIQAKYHRQYLDALEKHNKEAVAKRKELDKQLQDADNQLIALRIENMKAGMDKEIAELENQRRLELQKLANDAKGNPYIKANEMSVEINKKYDQKILDAKRKWAFDMLRVYEDLANRIQQFNKSTFETEVGTASSNINDRTINQKQSVGYEYITPSNYDNSRNLEEYYKKILDIEKNAANKEAQIQQERLDKELEYNKKEEELRHARLIDENGGEYVQQLRAGLITQEQYNKLIEDEKLAHNARMNALDKEYAAQSNQVTTENLQTNQKLYSDYYGKIIEDIERDKSKIDEIMSKQPVTDKAGWGVVNISKTNSNYNTALSQYDELKNKIIQKQQELDAALKAKTISPEDFAIRKRDLDSEVKAIDEAVTVVRERQKELIANFIQSIQMYIQAATQSFNQIMQAVWQMEDNEFDDEQERLDKWNDELDKALDKQQNIIEQHKSSIESIEDELATSRGDRRQHLIDQLNAEIEAQRRAQAEEERIQREKERAEKKQEELDLKRRKAEYKRNLTQAIVNGAMAVTMAAINKWPIPAIPMMALAASTTAAQIAIMASNKPYAKGGVLEGKSHAEGGIPIPGTGIEVEGKEYVVRKKSTTPNIDLLDYINKSERKLSLDDFIKFYGGKVRKNVTSMSPGRKYADGGALPVINDSYSFDDRLLSAFERYAERPSVVSVVDINNRQSAVKNVRVLAGLSD